MTLMYANVSQMQRWVQQVRIGLRTRGYYYEPEFFCDLSDAPLFIQITKLFGDLYIPIGTENTHPFLQTRPISSAPLWRPFDQRAPIRWHNDFSTRAKRPELSLSWIQQEDPAGYDNGAWWVASSAAVVAKLHQTREGKRLVTNLAKQAEPFGYRDAGGWRSFRIIVRANCSVRQSGLRFYGRALREGAWLRYGKVPERTKEIVSRIEEAADSVREVLPATTGSLLIVHNSLGLHYRSPQTVSGPKENRRKALLGFVKKLHQPL